METFQQLLGPLILLPLMFVVGLQLVPDDFRRVLSAPKAVVGGTLGQLLFLPLAALAVAYLVPISPMIAAGAVVLAATPGAGMSNVMAAVSRANVALSVTLTAIASLLAIVVLPSMTALGIRILVGDATEVEVPVSNMITQLVLFLAIPILLGMAVRSRRPDASARYVVRANRVAVIAILALTVLGAVSGEGMMPTGAEFGWTLFAAFLWTLMAMGIGWLLGWVLRLDPDDRFTLVIEFAARNLALTIVIALGSMGRLDLALFAGAYSLSGFPLVILLAAYRGRRLGRILAVTE